jgi:hypothetical protein
MSAGAIILGISIIIFCYILYIYMTKQDTYIISSVTDINTAGTFNDLKYMPVNNTFAYGIWLYVNNWNAGSIKNIFSFNGGNSNVISIYLESNNADLKITAPGISNPNPKSTSGAKSSGLSNSVTIASNFPLQRWVFIIVSLDGQYLDIYLDGKLVKSILLSTIMTINSNNSSSIVVGKFPSTTDAFVTYFNVWRSNSMDPGLAWKYYMKGNGMSNLNGYGVDLQLLQNNAVQSSYRIF